MLTRLAKSYSFSMILTVAGLCVAVIAGGNVWRGYFPVKLMTLSITFVGVIFLLLVRGAQQRAGLAHLNFDVFVVLGIVVLLGSWIFSPNLRQGLERLALLLGYLFFFYLMVDVLESGLDRKGVMDGLLIVTGILLALSILEIYLRYLNWWNEIGTRELLPPYPYRVISVLGHSNALMCVLNVCMPLAILQVLNKTSLASRIGATFWLVTYLIVVPFSSSRSGLIGLMVGVALMIVWLFIRLRIWKRLIQFSLTHKWLFVLAGVGILVFIAFCGWLIFNFSRHPSHGASFLGSRSIIWNGAFRVWRSSPWIGVGPGRFAYEYLQYGGSIPPDFWALSAHSLPIQILAEFGVIGALVFLLLLGSAGVYLWIRCQKARKTEQIWCQAILIGVAVWLVQSFFDDFTDYPGVMIVLILLAAWLFTSSDSIVERWAGVSGNVLWVPAIMLIGFQMIQAWSYYPMASGVKDAAQGHWTSAAQKITVSTKRDPNQVFYMTQAGLAHAMAWSQTQQYSSLSIARYFFQRALTVEKGVSLLWANLAILDWYSGDPLSAIQHMTQASKLAPHESAYLVNLGWFFEQNGDTRQAKTCYLDALNLNPSIITHPFWQSTSLRREVFAKWSSGSTSDNLQSEGYWQKAQRALQESHLNQAKYYIALSEWVGESQIAVLTVRSEICAFSGGVGQAIYCYQQLADKMGIPVLRYQETYFVNTYSLWLYHRKGLSFDIVPGFLQLTPDFGQFDALNRLYRLYSQLGDCAKAKETWEILQISLNGGALEPIPDMPLCLEQ